MEIYHFRNIINLQKPYCFFGGGIVQLIYNLIAVKIICREDNMRKKVSVTVTGGLL